MKSIIALLISLAVPCCANEEKRKPEAVAKVLYVTHEPGQYHDYTGQRKVFEKIAEGQTWDTTILSENYDDFLSGLKKMKILPKAMMWSSITSV